MTPCYLSIIITPEYSKPSPPASCLASCLAVSVGQPKSTASFHHCCMMTTNCLYPFSEMSSSQIAENPWSWTLMPDFPENQWQGWVGGWTIGCNGWTGSLLFVPSSQNWTIFLFCPHQPAANANAVLAPHSWTKKCCGNVRANKVASWKSAIGQNCPNWAQLGEGANLPAQNEVFFRDFFFNHIQVSKGKGKNHPFTLSNSWKDIFTVLRGEFSTCVFLLWTQLWSNRMWAFSKHEF